MNRLLSRAFLIAAVLACAFLAVPAQESSAIAPLGYSWSCSAYNAQCFFYVTTSNHNYYRWNFGDGSPLTGYSSSTSASHTYSIPQGQTPYNFTVYLLGYASAGGSPDNIIGCTITVYNTGPGPGGNPGTAGTCS